MRLLMALLAYLAAVVAIGSGAVGVLFFAPEPSSRTATARQETTTTASTRIQAWLERKAEGVAFAEQEKAAALADRERADALRTKLAETPEPYVAPRTRYEPYVAPRTRYSEERGAAERERAARVRQSARREARPRRRDLEADATYGYAAPLRRPSYPDQFLTMRDRSSP
jgi:hypothetical protein